MVYSVGGILDSYYNGGYEEIRGGVMEIYAYIKEINAKTKVENIDFKNKKIKVELCEVDGNPCVFNLGEVELFIKNKDFEWKYERWL